MDFIGHGIQSIGNEAVLTGLIIDFEDETQKNYYVYLNIEGIQKFYLSNF
ncbi:MULTISPECIES: hypothetical protein [Bacillus]|nr:MULTISPECIES: hypothetical protein [Bacillus]EJV80542.1 hypothetical protein IGE_02826 [Bacillus cereus HuB1-1]